MGIDDIYAAVLGFKKDKIAALVEKEVINGTDPLRILSEGLIAPLDEVGKQFSKGEIYIPEMLLSAQTTKLGIQVLRPLLKGKEPRSKGTVIVGTVEGDLHDIGKNLVVMMLEGAGFQVIDLGVDVKSDKFMIAAEENKADIVAMSALLTTTMTAMEHIVASVKRNIPSVKTIVGGAPVTQKFADKIRADGYGKDAHEAVELARKLLAT